MIINKFFILPNDCTVCSEHLNSWVLNLLMVFNSIDGFPLDNIKDILKYLVFQDILKGGNLQRANLREANLWTANLQNANLQNADLRDADLQRR